MKNVKVFCCNCGQEMWQDMCEDVQRIRSIYSANNAECSDCILARLREEDELYKGMEEDVARRMKEEGCVPIDAKLVQRMKDLAEGADVDLDALLPDEDD